MGLESLQGLIKSGATEPSTKTRGRAIEAVPACTDVCARSHGEKRLPLEFGTVVAAPSDSQGVARMGTLHRDGGHLLHILSRPKTPGSLCLRKNCSMVGTTVCSAALLLLASDKGVTET